MQDLPSSTLKWLVLAADGTTDFSVLQNQLGGSSRDRQRLALDAGFLAQSLSRSEA
jgi:hypothetical protein